MLVECDGCREYRRIKFTTSPRIYKARSHHRRLVCYKKSDYFFFSQKTSPSACPKLLGLEPKLIITVIVHQSREGLQIPFNT